MKKFLLLLFLPLLLSASFITVNEVCLSQAEAARFGGGRSFGNRPAMQRRAPAQAPAKQPGMAQSTAAQSSASRGFMGGGMGGMFGSLLAGSILGALIFGGAFQGIGAMDIVVIMLGVFMISRLLRARRTVKQVAGSGERNRHGEQNRAGRHEKYDNGAYKYSAPKYDSPQNPAPEQQAGANATDSFWGRLRSEQPRPVKNSTRSYDRESEPGAFKSNAVNTSAQTADADNSALRLPADFDLDDFMAGAKAMYARLQESWDNRDLEDSEQFTTPGVAAEIRRQAQEDPQASQTDILLINASLIGFESGKAESGQTIERAAVYFDVLMRERAGRENSSAREIWHFMRRKGETWKLDGLQQA